ncbi:MAG: hypothetical protein AAGC46_16615 [Solirubrobacteraceae bacterium]|nr:hypothetical protein [Patulibacter sp.]
MLRLPGLALLTIVAATAATPALAAKKSPESDKSLGPTAGTGKYLGGQDSPSMYHGCRKHDDQWYPYSLIDGSQTTMKSTSKYVAFTVNTQSFPTFAWTAKPGWKICAVVGYAALLSPSAGAGQFLTYFTYPSAPGTGSTAANGQETVKVKLPKDLAEGNPDLKPFAGQTLSPGGYRPSASFQRVTVYVKKS